MQKIDLSHRIQSWPVFEQHVLSMTQRYPGTRMLLVMETTDENHFQALEVICRQIATLAANRRIKGHMVGHKLTFWNDTTLQVVGYHDLQQIRGHQADILLVPANAPQEVIDTVLPCLTVSETPFLYTF